MKKVKITVVKCAFYEDLASKYAKPGTVLCPVHEVGQVFYTNGSSQQVVASFPIDLNN